MIKVYLIEMPINYHPRVIAFTNEEKAQECCDKLNERYPISASSSRNPFYVGILDVYEENDLVEAK